MRRSSRLSSASPAAENAPTPRKKPKKEASALEPSPSAPDNTVALGPALGDDLGGPSAPASEGPSAYELERLEKMKRNAMVMASLGLGTAAGGMRAAVTSEAAKRAKSKGLAPRKSRPTEPVIRTRESLRVRGKTPDGVPLEDPEEMIVRLKREQAGRTVSTDRRDRPRLTGDVTMDASNASVDGTLRLRQMMGGLVGRYGVEGDANTGAYELAEPDEALKRLRELKIDEDGVCKVVRERAYSVSWHPCPTKLLLAVGDKVGNVGLWTVDSETTGDGEGGGDGDGDDDTDGVFQFKPHTGSVARLTFDPVDYNKLISTSYDGTVRRMDVEKGAFEQIYANDGSSDAYITDGHLMAENRCLMLSDSVGDVTAVDLRTNQQVWKREAHEKKANTVHTHPCQRHLFVTASLDRSVKLWDARNLGPGNGETGVGGMKPIAEMQHFRSVNSAHFSPTGVWMVTVGQDDKLRLYQDLAEASSGSQVSASKVLPHDNQTGRWLTKFQASWDPKATSLFTIGSMQKHPHGIHLYSIDGGMKKPSAVEITGGDVMASIQSVVAFHPSRDILAGVNASGRAHVFR